MRDLKQCREARVFRRIELHAVGKLHVVRQLELDLVALRLFRHGRGALGELRGVRCDLAVVLAEVVGLHGLGVGIPELFGDIGRALDRGGARMPARVPQQERRRPVRVKVLASVRPCPRKSQKSRQRTLAKSGGFDARLGRRSEALVARGFEIEHEISERGFLAQMRLKCAGPAALVDVPRVQQCEQFAPGLPEKTCAQSSSKRSDGLSPSGAAAGLRSRSLQFGVRFIAVQSCRSAAAATPGAAGVLPCWSRPANCWIAPAISSRRAAGPHRRPAARPVSRILDLVDDDVRDRGAEARRDHFGEAIEPDHLLLLLRAQQRRDRLQRDRLCPFNSTFGSVPRCSSR
jgi:hypothetical protein